MYCPKCEFEIKGDDNINECPACGGPLTEAPEEESAMAPTSATEETPLMSGDSADLDTLIQDVKKDFLEIEGEHDLDLKVEGDESFVLNLEKQGGILSYDLPGDSPVNDEEGEAFDLQEMLNAESAEGETHKAGDIVQPLEEAPPLEPVLFELEKELNLDKEEGAILEQDAPPPEGAGIGADEASSAVETKDDIDESLLEETDNPAPGIPGQENAEGKTLGEQMAEELSFDLEKARHVDKKSDEDGTGEVETPFGIAFHGKKAEVPEDFETQLEKPLEAEKEPEASVLSPPAAEPAPMPEIEKTKETLDKLLDDQDQAAGPPPAKGKPFSRGVFAIAFIAAFVIAVVVLGRQYFKTESKPSRVVPDAVVLKKKDADAGKPRKKELPETVAKESAGTKEQLNPAAKKQKAPETPAISYSIQTDPFKEKQNALQELERLRGLGIDAYLVEKERMASFLIEKEKTASSLIYSIHTYSYKARKNALKEIKRMQQLGFDAYLNTIDLKDRGVWYRVKIGRFSTREEAEKVQKALIEKDKTIQSLLMERRENQPPKKEATLEGELF